MVSWRWLEDGKSVEITTDQKEAIRFEGATVKESEWQGFYARIADEGEVHTILKSAKAAFLMGTADYAGARANLLHLIQEFNAASEAVNRIAQEIGVFFTPPGLPEAFGRNRGRLVDFALEFTARTYVRGSGGV